jgi:hypothetical protein
MTTQYTPTLKLALPVTGELSGTWGDVVNDNITSMIEQAIAGLSTINTWTANARTLTTANGTTSESRCAMLVAATGTGGSALTGAGEIICPAAAKLYVLQNTTAFAITLKTSAGTGVAVVAGNTAFLFCDGTNVNACVTTIIDGRVTGNLTVDGNATINGNTTLGNATSDTITATARFNTDLLPSTDNARDLGSTGNSWKDLYIDGTAYLALVDINGGTIDGVSIGATTAATIINVDNLRLDGNTISSTDTNGNVVIAPNGTGDVQLDADTVRVGDAGAAAVLTSNGAGALTVTTGGAADLTLSTNAGTDSGTVVIANGANGNITLTPNGTGDVILSADRTQIGDANTDTTLTTNGTGSLNLSTNNGTNSGTIQIAQGVNGNITLTPNGTGLVSIPAAVISGGTANGVAYLNGSKVLTTGSALTFDGTRLGVNGSDPTVGGGQMVVASANQNGVIVNNTVAGQNSTLYLRDVAGSNPGRIKFMNGNWLTFVDNNDTEFMRLNGTGLGIGTSAPNGKLDISGGDIWLSDNSISAGEQNIYFANGTPRRAFIKGIYSSSADSTTTALAFGTNAASADGVERMRITPTGDVGIGTSSPAQKLDVSGNFRFANFSSGTTSGFFGCADTGSITLNFGGTTTPQKGRIFYSDNSDQFQFFTNSAERLRLNSSGQLETGIAGSASAPSFTRTGDLNTGIFFPAADTIAFAEGGAESMRLDSSGNLGIGTTSPLGRVHSSSASSGASPSANANQLIAENSGNAGITIASGASSLGNLFFADSGDPSEGFIQYAHTGRTMAFGAAGSTQMTLTSTGLGIKKSNPACALDVVGIGQTSGNFFAGFGSANAAIISSSSVINGGAGFSEFLFGNASGNNRGALTYQHSNDSLQIYVNAAERMRITADGFVGIRTNTPVGFLHVAPGNAAASSTAGAPIILQAQQGGSSASGGNILIGSGQNGSGGSNGYIAFGIGSATSGSAFASGEAMRLTAAGSLGIGTSSPVSRLQVVDSDITVTTSASFSKFNVTRTTIPSNVGIYLGRFDFSAYSTGTTYVAGASIQSFSSAAWSSTSAPSYLSFQTTASGSTSLTERMIIDASGNLGLGVTPSAWYTGYTASQVGVNGSVWANRTTADTNIVGIGSNQFLNSGATNRLYISNGFATRYEQFSGTHVWLTAPSGTAGNAITFTQAMTLDASGNLGIGVTSPTRSLDIGRSSAAGEIGAFITNTAGSTTNSTASLWFGTWGGASTTNIYNAKISAVNTNGGSAASDLTFWTYNGSGSSSGVIERARIDSSGRFMVGTTAAEGQQGLTITPNGSVGAAFLVWNRADTASASTAASFRNNGTAVGRIEYTNTATSYVTSSDYRLKNTIAPMTGALAKVALLKPCTYKWNADGSDGEGFIAHELAEVVPQCVTGEKDAVDAEGKPQYQGIDTSFLVATLTAAIQELKAEFDAYKASHP